MADLITINDNDAGSRVDRWFVKYYDIALTHVAKLARKGDIRVNKKRVKANDRLQAGDMVRVPPMLDKRTAQTRRVDAALFECLDKAILFEDNDFIAINKPRALAVQGGSKVSISVDDWLHCRFDKYNCRPLLVHRLDKDTSGVLLLAKHPKAARYATTMFAKKIIEKEYLALVLGGMRPREGNIDARLDMVRERGQEKMDVVQEGGKKAITSYKVLASIGDVMSYVQLVPHTGRKHQLRAHLSHIGHPILGDGKYGGDSAHINGIASVLHLHAHRLSFNDLSGKKRSINAPLPTYFLDSLTFFGVEQKIP